MSSVYNLDLENGMTCNGKERGLAKGLDLGEASPTMHGVRSVCPCSGKLAQLDVNFWPFILGNKWMDLCPSCMTGRYGKMFLGFGFLLFCLLIS